MSDSPSFHDLFVVMSSASVGDMAARVAVPDSPRLDDTATKLGLALNVLLDDLGASAAHAQRELAERTRIANHLRVLSEAAGEFSAVTYDLDRLLDAVARRLGDVIGDMCAIRAVTEDGEWIESGGAAYHRDPELLAATRAVMALGRQRVGEGISGRAAATRQPHLVPKVDPAAFAASSEPCYGPFLERFGVTSAITLPLVCRGNVVGVASLLRSDPAHPYDDDDLRLAQGVGEHAALAIQNARSLAAERAARDVAERATNALRQAEARFARLQKVGILGIIVIDLDGHVSDINDTLLQMLGYSRDEILSGRVAWRSLTPPDWQELDTRAVEQLRASGTTGLREKEFVHKDGTRIPVLAASAMLEDGTTRCISFVLDLTERKNAEAAIESLRRERAADAKFRGLLESAPDAMVIVGTDGAIVFVNGQACAIFGYARSEMIGQPLELLIPERSRPTLPQPSPSEGLDGVRPMGVAPDRHGRRKDGTEFPIEVTTSPLATDDGLLVSSAIRDVTESKKVLIALARAKDRAESASRELEAFSYSVAHDLRAPLRGMSGFAQVLLDTYGEKLGPEGQDWLEEIQFNANKMADLIDALLSLAQLTRSELRPADVDLSALARELSSRLVEREPNRIVEIAVQDHLHAEMDPRLARSLVENLLTNALKFTSKVPVARIAFGSTESRDGSPVFVVRDNGAGFDMAFAGKLFRPFQRLHTTREFAGTGIGLATAHRIVQRHGGRIWAEGTVDGGATLYFTFASRAADATI